MVKKQLMFGRKTMEIGNEKKVFHLLTVSRYRCLTRLRARMAGQGAVRLSWAGQAETLAGAVAGLHTDTGHLAQDSQAGRPDLLLRCEGSHIPAHRLVLAAASPFLAALVSDTGEESPLCLVGLTHQQVVVLCDVISLILNSGTKSKCTVWCRRCWLWSFATRAGWRG